MNLSISAIEYNLESVLRDRSNYSELKTKWPHDYDGPLYSIFRQIEKDRASHQRIGRNPIGTAIKAVPTSKGGDMLRALKPSNRTAQAKSVMNAYFIAVFGTAVLTPAGLFNRDWIHCALDAVDQVDRTVLVPGRDGGDGEKTDSWPVFRVSRRLSDRLRADFIQLCCRPPEDRSPLREIEAIITQVAQTKCGYKCPESDYLHKIKNTPSGGALYRAAQTPGDWRR